MRERLHSRGFEVLAFPSNQFHEQEPGTSREIREFVSKYGVSFPVFAKIDVNGPETHPLYRFLKAATVRTGDVRWNFEKVRTRRGHRHARPIPRSCARRRALYARPAAPSSSSADRAAWSVGTRTSCRWPTWSRTFCRSCRATARAGELGRRARHDTAAMHT